MSDVALYFPYVNLPADAWVKAAALHWPQLGRIRPLGYYGLRDSDTVKRLKDEFDFIVDVRPGWGHESWVDDDVLGRVEGGYAPPDRRRVDTEDQVDALFYDFLDRHQDELIPRYGAAALGVESLRTWEVYDELLPLDPRLEKVHPGKMSYQLAQRLADAGLLVSRSYQWRRASDGKVLYTGDLAMHPRLAGVYLAILADVVARENGMTPVTDQALISAVTSGWTIEAMAEILLADDTGTTIEGPTDYSHVFAVMAMQTVVPRDLAEVPVERIIEARRRLLPELMRYREFLDSLTPDFVEISGVPDPGVRAARLRNHVESKIAQPIDEMERELGRLGMQPVRAVLSLQTLAPPAALGVLAGAVHLPSVVTGAGVVAGCLVGAASSALDQRRQVLAGHPAGYLLNLRHELSPSDTVAQIRSAIRRAAPVSPGRRTRRSRPRWLGRG
ncbi:DUF6236 family protein [Streptomyces sporangiiformans]|uniref:Uncharacterized protein n=1 Tax=Streptomyces sporangiiformans TaxID=2315329 RepID=A0A505DEQ6_9ACTN|nr:DUF6236 family protein [Streptomyces sporangiiformans]TPQ21032.1 hypothetical protein FGD71_017370 [Streptomyces sporangiiformans]